MLLGLVPCWCQRRARLGHSRLCWLSSLPQTCRLEPPALVLSPGTASQEPQSSAPGQLNPALLVPVGRTPACHGPVLRGSVSPGPRPAAAVMTLEIYPGGSSNGLQRKHSQELGCIHMRR